MIPNAGWKYRKDVPSTIKPGSSVPATVNKCARTGSGQWRGWPLIRIRPPLNITRS
jgi:hypothetical protein